ncbi:hypothetical protein RMN56_24065 [Micromonospora halotolerans]|uniref:DUF4333 domain-containing protein n=1 Tax=Micromonospora halotolerans TaxID=709879 RepID=A0ABY9ZSB9_9ACTN|nr:hypothetical protein [Micromonospora halotolerans]WNM38194.1 hypothetical protein RMN56_24065 [Micromonospora halotolerans]
MSGRQKVLLAALAGLLAVLYLVAVGGGRHDRGDPAAGPGWLARFGGNAGTVDPATVTVACVPPAAEPSPSAEGLVVGFGIACRLRVADPGGLRSLVLRSGAPFVVSAPAPGDADVTVTDEVTPGDDGTAVAKVAVDGATEVALRCPGGGGCVVTVARS